MLSKTQIAYWYLFGIINFKTGHRIVLRRYKQQQAFLKLLRKRYRDKPLVLLLDKASCYDSPRSQFLAAQLGIKLIWLSKQWSELDIMDHLWRELKRNISSNRQFKTIDKQASILRVG
ncbi:MAG: hypothetical protein C4307_05440 [Chloroflexota bacterium]